MYSALDNYIMTCLMIWQRNNKFTVAWNRENKETDSVNSVQSAL